MELTNRLLKINKEKHITDEILSIYSIGNKTVGMQEFNSKESYSWNIDIDEIYKQLRNAGYRNFFKVQDMVFNLNYVDSCCIQTHPNIADSKGMYSLLINIKDGSKHRFGFNSHIDAERYFKAINIEMKCLQEENKDINV